MYLTDNARFVLQKRYLQAGESPEDRFREVARFVASAEERNREKWEEKFYALFDRLDFLPNTPCIANAGRGTNLNACFVLPVTDALTNESDSGIMDTARNAALIHQTGGGTGFDFSRIRPAGSTVASSNGVASGPVSFLRLYNAVTETIKQGGIRRGANMGILHVDHPDIEEFVTSKQDQAGLNNFNISVAVTDEFMEKVHEGHPGPVKLWNLIIDSAWTYGDPGVFFIDEANRNNPLSFPIRATNPCGEIPMPDNDACNLGSINLGNFYTSDEGFDYTRFQDTVAIAIRFLDNVVTVNEVPVPAIQAFTKQTRRLGLGVMGWADLLNKMRIPYDSAEAIVVASNIASVLRQQAYETSARLAEEKGAYPLSQDGKYRNVALLSVAPTGSISTIANCSAGIEPYFDTSVTRTLAIGTISEKYENADKPWFRTAMGIDPYWHVQTQAAWQHNIDNGVSKTVNLTNSATPQDVQRVYEHAWQQRCKGITIYRDGSRDLQVYRSSKCIEGACETEGTAVER